MKKTLEGRLRRSIAAIVALTLVAAVVLLLKAHSVKSRLPNEAPSSRPAR